MFFFFFFNDTATTEIYTLSLHDALPILRGAFVWQVWKDYSVESASHDSRSEEHTSELQSQSNLVCRLLLEKKKKKHTNLHAVEQRTRLNTSKLHIGLVLLTNRLREVIDE